MKICPMCKTQKDESAFHVHARQTNAIKYFQDGTSVVIPDPNEAEA